jgi:ribose/xylose/arabinose/galactoside ABC-type transport system permease subunit
MVRPAFFALDPFLLMCFLCFFVAKEATYEKRAWHLCLLIVLCIIVSVVNPNFLLPINLQNLARQIGAFGIFSIGLGLVIITGGIELSVGSMMALLACCSR